MKKQFTGPLEEHLPPLRLNEMGLAAALTGDWTRYKELRQLRSEQERDKLLLLFAHYGIDPDAPAAALDLALSLARDLVKGFQEPPAKKRGAKTKWTFDVHMKLHAEVQELLAAPGVTQDAVFTKLAELPQWKRFLRTNEGYNAPNSAHALEKQYRAAERQLRDLRRHYEATIGKATKRKSGKKT